MEPPRLLASGFVHGLLRHRERAGWAVTLFPLLFLLVMTLCKVLSPRLYLFLVGEDNVVESATFLAYLMAWVVAMSLSIDFYRQQHGVYALLYGVLSAGLFLIAMEEISWGQRIFHMHTPAYFAAHNYKDEINFHNLSGFPIDDSFIVVAFYGAFARFFVPKALKGRYPTLVELVTPAHSLFWYFFGAFALYSYYHSLHYIYGLQWKEVLAAGRYVTSKDQEPTELLLSLGFLLFIVFNKYKYGHAQPASAPAGRPDGFAVGEPADTAARQQHPLA
jgi:hypothetical protein